MFNLAQRERIAREVGARNLTTEEALRQMSLVEIARLVDRLAYDAASRRAAICGHNFGATSALRSAIERIEPDGATSTTITLTPGAWQVVLSALEIISPDDDEHAQIAIDTIAEIRRAL